MKKLIFATVMCVLLAACGKSVPQLAAQSTSHPAVAASTVQHALAGTGVTIAGPISAPAGYQGFVARYRGQALPVYVPPDGKHVLIGSMYDMTGKDLTTAAMRRAVTAISAAQWQQVEHATWFSTGKPDAARVVYAFMDTQCPYCHRLWLAAQPWLKDGKVDLRIIPVAVISAQSLPGGAAVLEAADPAAAWRAHEAHFGQPSKTRPAAPKPATTAKIMANNALMQRLGFTGTPGVIYKDANGQIHALHGLPRDAQQVKAIFGG